IALCQAECIASYSAEVTVKSSGSSTRKATVMSASLLTMHPCSIESSGNLDSSVAILLLFLILLSFEITDKVISRAAVHKVAWVHPHGSSFHQPVLPILSVHGKRLPHHKGGTH